MKPNRIIQKCFAIILLLVFCQKIGGGLYFHNWLHSNNCKQSSQPADNKIVSYNCSCVDDFSMPFAEDAEKVSQIISSVEVELSASYKFSVPLSSTIFYSLRGPPSFLS